MVDLSEGIKSAPKVKLTFGKYEAVTRIYLKEASGGTVGLQEGLLVKKRPANAGDTVRCGFDPWVGKTPWRRTQLRTPLFLQRKSHGSRNLVGYSRWGGERLDTTEATKYSTQHKGTESRF